MLRRVAVLMCLAVLGGVAVARAQTVPDSAASPEQPPVQAGLTAAVRAAFAERVRTIETAQAPNLRPDVDPRRACEGCPRRSVGKAFFQTTVVNVFYEFANLARGQVTAKITPKTWWANMEQGWVWDLDDFLVNQVGHPYQGNNYFNAGRANGLSFYESAAITAFGSATWEYFGETNHASLNDLINTTLGGIALGEMFHRTAWLMRDTRASGRGRLWSEIGATVIDPITGVNRFITGDASRVSPMPSELTPTTLGGQLSMGAIWRGVNTRAVHASGQPLIEMDVLYGDLRAGRSRTAYDAFAVRLAFGGGGGFSEARVRGRLLGQPFKHERLYFMVDQGYTYQGNDAYHYGAQSFNANIGVTQPFSSRVSMSVLGWGGLTVLGAIDSLPVDLSAPPPEETDEGSAGQGVSEGPRYYDYGPGGNFGAYLNFTDKGRTFASLLYEGRHLYSVDGVRANHLLQKMRIDLLVPLRGKIGLGATAEYFSRKTYYQDAVHTIKSFHYPQLRAYFTWRLS